MQRNVWAPVGTFVLVGAVAAAAVTLGGGGSGRDAPAPLRLAGAGERAASASLANGTPTGYELVGVLPQGRPADATAWSLRAGTVSDTAAARLAAALGEQRPVRERGGGWRVGGLAVGGDGLWSWSTCARDLPVPADGPVQMLTTGCAASGSGSVSGGTVTTGGGTTEPGAGAEPGSAGSWQPGRGQPHTTGPVAPGMPPDAPVTSGSVPPGTAPAPLPPAPLPASPPPATPQPGSPTPARPTSALAPARLAAAVEPVLAAAGLQVQDARLDTSAGTATVRPVVHGLRTSGVETRVRVSPAAQLLDASGWIGTPVPGDRYPLLTATEAFGQLPPMMRALAPCGPKMPCPQPRDQQIVGAELGLVLQQRLEGGSVLVPAWLFSVADSLEQLAVVAVQPRYLAGPEEPRPSPVGSPVDGTPPGASGRTAARQPVHIERVVAAAKGVTVTYGESGSCPLQRVSAVAKEDARTVVLVLEADALGDRACTADLHLATLQVGLSQPLGSRTVIDGSTGTPVAANRI